MGNISTKKTKKKKTLQPIDILKLKHLYNILINDKQKKEFRLVLDEFQPDFVFFFGTTGFNSLAEVCLENKVKYYLQFLTSDYYCAQNFAGLENGPCFKCIKGNYFNAF